MRGEDKLLELQNLDIAIDRAGARRREIESGEAVRDLRSAADEAERRLGELRLRLGEESREQARLEHEADSLGQKAAAEERRLYDGSIANAKELEALQHEVANLKTRRSASEDLLLEAMERIEELEAQAVTLEAEATTAREELDAALGGAAGELDRLTAEIASALASREALLPEIDDEVLALYDELRPQKKGVAAAALVDGVCQGCHEKLSALEIDRLKHTDGMKRCEYCRRILVFG
ncbi:MAG TPA: C4-type zinc ribbon domain-containing protein [Actinomycetota bacterium]|nr:C4-type zinc ribbon domain-containing protein [Actinomycetota bacterium]